MRDRSCAEGREATRGADDGLESWLGRPCRTQLARSVGRPAFVFPFRAMREVAKSPISYRLQRSSSGLLAIHALTQSDKWFEHPFDQLAAIEHKVCRDLHTRFQGLLLAVDIDGLHRNVDVDSIRRPVH